MRRYLQDELDRHLRELRQMAAIVGPRQVGKTTLARDLLGDVRPGENYFNWDLPAHRRLLLTRLFTGSDRAERIDLRRQKRVCFDEIHKYKRWKNSLKGLFDQHEPDTHWILTGSAMLGVYRKGQDSLLGRYFTYHLAPFSVAELAAEGRRTAPTAPEKLLERPDSSSIQLLQGILDRLLSYGGFPEPYLKASDTFLRRWRETRLDRLINQDLAAAENLRDLSSVEHLMFLLAERAAGLLSINGLREEIEVHFTTVKHWLTALERVFYGFRVYPYAGKLARAQKKEPKWYLWDWTEAQEAGARLENLVAVHLRKYVDFLNDTGRDELSLHFIRDKEKREVDFLLCRRGKPVLPIECKTSAGAVPPNVTYFAKRFQLSHAVVLTREPREPVVSSRGGVRVHTLPAAAFLSRLV